MLSRRSVPELLRSLEERPLTRDELEGRLGIPARTLSRRLAELDEAGLVVCGPHPSDRRRTACRLSDAGREMLEVGAAIEAAGARRRNGRRNGDLPPLAAALADRRGRAILRALLDGPQPFGELLRLVPGLTHGALERHLRNLHGAGLVRECAGSRRDASHYEGTELPPRLRRAALLAARWCWRWHPDCAPRMAGDLGGLLRLAAPFVRLDPALRGVVVLRVESPDGEGTRSDVHLSVAEGGVALLDPIAADGADARIAAAPLDWCEALLGEGAAGLVIDGDRDLTDALLEALVAALAV